MDDRPARRADGTDEQRAALADVFLGKLGGPQVGVLPWVRKARHVVDVRANTISLVPDGEGYLLRVSDAVQLRATRPVESDAVVRCGIPGYDQPGQEVIAGTFRVHDAPLSWDLHGRCGFATDFAYHSRD